MAHALILGTAQDGGFPHAGCRCRHCAAALADPRLRRRVAALGLVAENGPAFLVDATPDLASQVRDLPRLEGLLLTHAHMGHVAGLLWLGTEAMAVRDLPLHAGPRLLRFLSENEPWGTLIRSGRLRPRPLEDGREVSLAPDLAVTPVAVPHRAEWSETFGYSIRGPERTLLWLPDIDRLDPENAARLLDGVDLALIDGTFLSGEELPGRDLAEIPHPLVEETVELLGELRPAALVSFVHLNHSNPLVLPDSAAAAALGRRYGELGLTPAARGPVASDGESLTLGTLDQPAAVHPQSG